MSDDANSSTSGHSAKGIKKLATTSSTDSTTKVVPVGCDDSGGTGRCGGGLAATLPSPPPAPQTMQQQRYPPYPRRDSRDRDWGGYIERSGHSGTRQRLAATVVAARPGLEPLAPLSRPACVVWYVGFMLQLWLHQLTPGPVTHITYVYRV